MQLKIINIVNWSVLIALAVLSILFYKERTCILDASYQVGSIFIRNDLAIQVNRFGAAVVQIFPLISMNLGLSLKTSLVLYSFSFVLEAIIVYWVLTNFLKQKDLGTALIIFLTVMVGHTFYWTQSELLQACVLSFLFAGLLKKLGVRKICWWKWLIIAFVEFVVLFLHPLGFIPILFFWLFVLIDEKFKVHWSYVAIIFMGLIIITYKHMVMPTPHYDKINMNHSSDLVQKIPDFFKLKSTYDFKQYLMDDYFFFLPILVLSLIYYFFSKKFLKLILVFLSFSCTLILINGSYDWGIRQFHVESFYRILVIFPATAIGVDLLLDTRFSKVLLVILPLIFVVRINKIYHNHWEYTQRLHYSMSLIKVSKKYSNDKFYIFYEDMPMPSPHNYWSSGMSTLLLSTLDAPNDIRSIIAVNRDNDILKKLKGGDGVFCTSFDTINVKNIKTHYFSLSELGYQRLTKADFE